MVTLLSDALNPASNAFTTIAAADLYHSQRLYSDKWTTQVEIATKQQALIWASRLISRSYKWKGVRVKAKQQLAFPRYGITYSDGYTVDYDTYPSLLVEATHELALILLTGDPGGAATAAASSGTSSEQTISELKVSSITLKFGGSSSTSDSSSTKTTPTGNGITDQIYKILSEFIKSTITETGGVLRVRRT